MAAIELPMFPLNLVLFPGMVLPLHIFEPRYRQMVTECQQENRPFGVVLVRPESKFMYEETYPIGTTAEIHEMDELKDGRFNLMARGVQRFRILSQHRKKPYLSALVEPFEDISEPTYMLTSCARQAEDLFRTYLSILLEAAGRKTMQVDLPTIPAELSYFIASVLDAENEQKQQLLENPSTLQRLQEEITFLHREVPFLRQMLVGDSHFADHPDRSMLN